MTYFSSISHISLGLSFKRALSTKAKGHGVFFEGIQNYHHPLSNVSVFEVHNFAYCAVHMIPQIRSLIFESHLMNIDNFFIEFCLDRTWTF